VTLNITWSMGNPEITRIALECGRAATG
jgi:hypothetical protein